ncbi:hypothetical protein BV898_03166 [Hypsibius exemplaris]|uniref:Uncharacterized protein n=1 Tax=Hypsibius exemplaris TaxID=2072580 RepID=A0A1W0X5B8_HYPEX|nr:hypothetical protein BV898_03166 [Hypsibius exemplaris]
MPLIGFTRRIILKESSAKADGFRGPQIQPNVEELLADMPDIWSSGKMIAELYLQWLHQCLFSVIGVRSLAILNLSSAFKNTNVMEAVTEE